MWSSPSYIKCFCALLLLCPPVRAPGSSGEGAVPGNDGAGAAAGGGQPGSGNAGGSGGGSGGGSNSPGASGGPPPDDGDEGAGRGGPHRCVVVWDGRVCGMNVGFSLRHQGLAGLTCTWRWAELCTKDGSTSSGSIYGPFVYVRPGLPRGPGCGADCAGHAVSVLAWCPLSFVLAQACAHVILTNASRGVLWCVLCGFIRLRFLGLTEFLESLTAMDDWDITILEGLPGAGKTTIGINVVKRLYRMYGPGSAVMITIRGIVAILSGSRTYAWTFDPAGAADGDMRADALNRAVKNRLVWYDEAEEASEENLMVSHVGRLGVGVCVHMAAGVLICLGG